MYLRLCEFRQFKTYLNKVSEMHASLSMPQDEVEIVEMQVEIGECHVYAVKLTIPVVN